MNSLDDARIRWIIEDAIIRTLCSVYHGRIAYPGDGPKGEQKTAKAEPAADTGDAKPAGEPAPERPEQPAPAGRTA